ncbi:MAG: hypothetical protein ABIO39_00850, partial [Caulobacteraceae bacterium]
AEHGIEAGGAIEAPHQPLDRVLGDFGRHRRLPLRRNRHDRDAISAEKATLGAWRFEDAMRVAPVCTILGLLALTTGVAAQPAPQELRTQPGAPLVLGVETSGQADCTLGRISQTRILVPPRHGVATVRQARVRAKGDKCPGAPGYLIIYRSDPEFMGVDDLTLQINDGSKSTLKVFRITVAGVQPPVGA